MKYAAIFLLALTSIASAVPGYWRIMRRDGTNTLQNVEIGPVGTPTLSVVGTSAAGVPAWFALGNGIIDGGSSVLEVDPSLVTTATQTALNLKADSSSLSGYPTNTFLASTLTGYATNLALTAGLGSKLDSADFTWANLPGVPATFAPSAHTHSQSEITGLVTALAGKETSGSAASAQAYSIQRANHTGTQAWSTITATPTTASGYGIADAVVTGGSYADPSWVASLAYSKLTGTPTIPTNTNQLTNGAGFITGITSGNVTTALGFTPYNVTNPAGYTTNTGTVTSVGLTSTNLTVTGSPVTTSGTLTVTPPSTGTAGTYHSVTTDSVGRVTAGTAMETASPARTIASSTAATGWQVDSARWSEVNYDVDLSTTTTIGGPSSVVIYLETANTNSTTPGDWTIVGKTASGQTVTLAVVLQSAQTATQPITKKIPPGKWVRLRQVIAGTASAALATVQEIKF